MVFITCFVFVFNGLRVVNGLYKDVIVVRLD